MIKNNFSKFFGLCCFVVVSIPVFGASFEARLGDFGLDNVSSLTQFYTGKASLWRNKGVEVYNLQTGKRYAKTRARMQHLPGTIGQPKVGVRIDKSLIPAKTVTLNVPASIEQICTKISLWKCSERLSVFNSTAANAPVKVLLVPLFIPAEIPNPPAPFVPPPPPPPNPTPTIAWYDIVHRTVPIWVLFVLLIILAVLYFADVVTVAEGWGARTTIFPRRHGEQRRRL